MEELMNVVVDALKERVPMVMNESDAVQVDALNRLLGNITNYLMNKKV